MSTTNLFKLALVLFVLFAIGEIIFTFQRYGKDIFKPRPGSCKILESKYCKQGKVVKWKNYTFIGFNFPEGIKVPLFAAVDGHLLLGKEDGKTFSGLKATLRTNTENYTLSGNIDLKKFHNLTGTNIKAGEIIGYAEATTAKSLGYDIVFSIFKVGPEVEEDKLKELFEL